MRCGFTFVDDEKVLFQRQSCGLREAVVLRTMPIHQDRCMGTRGCGALNFYVETRTLRHAAPAWAAVLRSW